MNGRGKGSLYGAGTPDQDQQSGWDLEDCIEENKKFEGKDVQELAYLYKTRNWEGFKRLIKQLEEKGYSKTRMESLVARATFGNC